MVFSSESSFEPLTTGTIRPVVRYWLNIRRTPVVAELVALAAQRTGVHVEYRDRPGELHDMDMPDAAEAFDNGYNPDRLLATHGSLWQGDVRDKTQFWNELGRLAELVKRPLDEPVLASDVKMYGGYWYVMDGVAKECLHFNGDDNHGITVATYMRRYGVKEVRRCDQTGRINRLPAQPERSTFDRNFRTQMRDADSIFNPLSDIRGALVGTPNHWDKSGRTIKQARRKPRNSNKIKKVK